jgi:hypothetical protein
VVFSCENIYPINDCHGDVISLIFFDILLYSLFHLLEVKKKCSLKNYLKDDFVEPQDYKSSGAEKVRDNQ